MVGNKMTSDILVTATFLHIRALLISYKTLPLEQRESCHLLTIISVTYPKKYQKCNVQEY